MSAVLQSCVGMYVSVYGYDNDKPDIPANTQTPATCAVEAVVSSSLIKKQIPGQPGAIVPVDMASYGELLCLSSADVTREYRRLVSVAHAARCTDTFGMWWGASRVGGGTKRRGRPVGRPLARCEGGYHILRER